MFRTVRRVKWLGAACMALMVSLTVSAQSDKGKKDKEAKDSDARRPKLSLKATPLLSIAPARIVLTAELTGGAKDFEEYYCPTIEWEWGDGTMSESTYDCPPYEAGTTEIRRRFSVEHIFHAGVHRVVFRLKRHDKTVANSNIDLQVQPGLRDAN